MKKPLRNAAKLKLTTETVQALTEDILKTVAGGSPPTEYRCGVHTQSCSVNSPGCP